MKFSLGVAALAATVAAVGKAKVTNKCNFDVSVWSVGGQIQGPWRLTKDKSYSETFVVDPVSGGKALKITLPEDGLYTGAPQTNFAYSLDGNKIWYDLSDVFGDAFAGHKVVAKSAKASCPEIVWSNGIPPAGSQVKVCDSNFDVELTLCA